MSYVRVSILGNTVGGEVWSINPVFDPTGEFGSSVDQAQLDAASAAIGALSPGTDLLTALSNALTVVGARVEVRDDAGDDLLALSEYLRPTPLLGTGTPKLTAQSAAVVSLRTNTPGASGRGRIYWPAVGVSVDANLRIGVPLPSAIQSGMKTYLLAIRSALATAFPTIGFDLAVRSRVQQATPHVNRIQVGNVPDTQRRRRDTFPEVYVTTTFP